jgi:hypothetical protein
MPGSHLALDKNIATKTRHFRLINYTTNLLYLLLILSVGGIFKEHTNQRVAR